MTPTKPTATFVILTLLTTVLIDASDTFRQHKDDRSLMHAQYLPSRKLSVTTKCLESIDTVHVWSIADVEETPDMKCEIEKSEKEVYSFCDATTSSYATKLIETCSEVGGRDITVRYRLNCEIDDINIIEDKIGPLCLPPGCGLDEYIEYVNIHSVGITFAESGGCIDIVALYKEHEVGIFPLLVTASIVFSLLSAIIILLIYCRKRSTVVSNGLTVSAEFS